MFVLQADIVKLDNYPSADYAKGDKIWKIKKIVTDKTGSPSTTEEMFPINPDWKVDTGFVFSFDDITSLDFK